MRLNSEATEIARLQEENRQLRGLLAAKEKPPAIYMPASSAPAPDFRALFEALPSVCIVFLPDTPRFTIAAVSDAYLRVTKTERGNLIDCGVFQAFPANPDVPQATDTINLRASLEYVLHTRTAHTLPLQRYDVRRPEGEGGGFEERYWSLLSTPIFGGDGEVAYILHQVEDVTERVRLEEQEEWERAARMQAEERAANILEGMSDAFLVLDKEWRIRFMNREAARLNNKAPEEFLGKTHWEEWPASVGSPLETAYRRAMAEQVAVHLEHHYEDAAHDVWLEINAYPTEDNLGIFYRDIRERKQAEEALQQSESRFRAAVLAVGDIIWTNSPSGQMEGEQAGWAAFTGQSYAEYQGYGWANAVHPDDAQSTIDAWNDAVAQRKMFVFEHRLRRYDGVWRLFGIRGVPIFNAEGSIREWVGVHTDITERRESEADIRALNARLRRSMRETHHRVKNNLQVISAMIEMQVMEHKGEQSVPLEEFVRLKAHVYTLAIVHDLLTLGIKEEEDAQRLSTKAVLDRLLPMLQQTAWKQSVRYVVDEVELTSKQCIALSLVLNELVANALKHGKKEATVYFTVEGNEATLAVGDDGDGFPENFDPKKAANTGLELVGSLVHTDLRGTLMYANKPEGGGFVTVVFPLPPDEE